MPIKFSFFWFLLAVFGSKYSQAQQTNHNGLTAQIDPSSTPTEIDWAHFELELEESPETWTFKISEKQKNLMVDFQHLVGIPQKMWVLSETDEPVFEDMYLDGLSKNTIYEINLATLPSGNYAVEIENEMGELMRHNFVWERK